LGKIVVKNGPPVHTPDFEPPLAEDFIPAQLFDGVKLAKTWDLNAVRGGPFGIGWAIAISRPTPSQG
jgi:hypothetical protein